MYLPSLFGPARPASALLPVSDLTQMPATRLIALSPSIDVASPARYSRALRRSVAVAAGPAASRTAIQRTNHKRPDCGKQVARHTLNYL
jgi:hypothetical protein